MKMLQSLQIQLQISDAVGRIERHKKEKTPVLGIFLNDDNLIRFQSNIRYEHPFRNEYPLHIHKKIEPL